ncbi:hypothetical protein QBC33DRAFT_604725 [Phialemonium atrogriseum]|uniref:Uncharacterized protein n=1 Tax=Phialemonium atrogriseum TaxID=1093897 RepID=A0AAJ0FP28_9PEZI|nr:uncharacterized protein QBC33DRAFT_604725 [Phialemonium atrogriseum]KAK1769649.1 hypothetical protein QBC33DRAFT_604725 [Phialemonium atrogriseum]
MVCQSLGQEDKLPAYLVRPSGSLDSLLAHRLNQPSFTASQPEDGETADPSNGCIAMVMGNAYEPGKTLVFDHIHRRDARSEGIEKYHPELLNCHEEYTDKIGQSMMAKVEILYGEKVQSRVLTNGLNFEVLPLWGEFEGVSLLLVFENSYRNKDLRFELWRIMLIAYHPQFMFYQSRNNDCATRQDKTMVAAARMVGNAVPLVDRYFADKIWLKCVPSTFRQREMRLLGQVLEKDHRMPAATVLEEDDDSLVVDQSKSETEGAWQAYFVKKPHSNDDLRKLIPLALDSLDTCTTEEDWKLPTDLPDPVLE